MFWLRLVEPIILDIWNVSIQVRMKKLRPKLCNAEKQVEPSRLQVEPSGLTSVRNIDSEYRRLSTPIGPSSRTGRDIVRARAGPFDLQAEPFKIWTQDIVDFGHMSDHHVDRPGHCP